ncbi:MAG: TRAP transporter large permease subunit [Actinomycetota bacterium]
MTGAIIMFSVVVGILGLETGVFLSLLMFVVFMAMILSGYNVAFSFAATALAFAFIGDLTDTFDPTTLNALPQRWFGAINDQTLLAVPLFVLMGAILERSGLAERLLTAIGMLMGGLRGGVAGAVVIVGTLLAAATGVVAATVIVMGLLSLPAMVRLGYDHKLATGVITASGTLAQLLPPSIVLILLAQQLGIGILNLFAGALLPGLLLSSLYIAYVLIISYVKPEVGPAMPVEQRTLPGNPSMIAKVQIAFVLSVMMFLTMLLASGRTAIIFAVGTFVIVTAILSVTKMLAAEVMVSVVPILLLIIGVLASIFGGIATPSESGAVGVFGALILTGTNWLFDRLLRREGAEHVEPRWRLGWSELKQAGESTANIVVLVMTLLFASTFFSLMFFQLGGSDQTSEWLTSIGGGKWGFVIVAMIALFLLGINLEFLEITFIVVPIFVPAMQELGFSVDEFVWFAVLMAVNLNMAFISPPVGFSLFYLQSVAPPEVKTASIHKGALPFMALQGVALVVLMVAPQITEFSIDVFG